MKYKVKRLRSQVTGKRWDHLNFHNYSNYNGLSYEIYLGPWVHNDIQKHFGYFWKILGINLLFWKLLRKGKQTFTLLFPNKLILG